MNKEDRHPPRPRRTSAINIVTEQERVKSDIAQCIETIVDCFDVFISENMLEDILRYTNHEMTRRYATRDNQTAESVQQPIAVNELMTFLRLLIAIGGKKNGKRALR
jgi:adenosyl cobinamide kinase/adenosyl cobinamide phosphate guanylyltransferase